MFKEFFNQNCKCLELYKNGLLSYCFGNNCVVKLRRDGQKIFMENGSKAAKVFGLDRPTRLRMEFIGPKNRFTLIFFGDFHEDLLYDNVKEEVIVLSFDDEMTFGEDLGTETDEELDT